MDNGLDLKGHVSDDHKSCKGKFPIGGPLTPCRYLTLLLRYQQSIGRITECGISLTIVVVDW